MIKANELRIGNYYTNGIDFYEVIPPVIEKVFESERLWCNPIPLTEEILFKCGFTRFGKSFRLNTFEYCPISKNLVIHGHGGYYTGLILKIQYLHQLQNLYFALTGEELTIK